MLIFEEPFSDPAKLTRDWVVAPGMVIRNNVLAFSPDQHDRCAGVTRRKDFGDFSLTVDVRIVHAAVGLVLRAGSPDRYYMIQFDLANNPSVVWFHTFTPEAREGYHLEVVPSLVVPRAGSWYQMRIVARGATFAVSLGGPGGALQHCASWRDPNETYQRGAIGVWEHGGEAGEYRGLRVETLDDAMM